MRKSILFLGFVALLQVVGPAEAGVRCTRELAPVCARGPTGVRTYDNAACARVDHARILRRGTCRKDIEPPAPNRYDGSHCAGDGSRPVCAEVGASRMTFPSVCHAAAVGGTVVSWGACAYTY